jgi:porphobilinogen synthase
MMFLENIRNLKEDNMAIRRFRRLRQNSTPRGLVRETRLGPDSLIMPLFVCAGDRVRKPLPSIPGSSLLAGDALSNEARRLAGLGIPAVLLFGVVDAQLKDSGASCCLTEANPVIPALRRLKHTEPGLVLIADLCLCEYTSHGHCGILRKSVIDNDATLAVLARAAVALAQAGADIIAPSGVMDGTVTTLRFALDAAGHESVALMPYSAKFRSVLYDPFKAATCSQPGEPQHATHQLDPANGREALRKIRQDVAEGADLVIVKPAIPSLDVLALARQETNVPLAAFDVSGSYRMMLNYCGNDPGLRRAMMLETLTSIKRAGASLIITYHAPEAAKLLA